jgi:hypothetical protein
MPGGWKAVFDEGKKIAATGLIVVENRSHPPLDTALKHPQTTFSDQLVQSCTPG